MPFLIIVAVLQLLSPHLERGRIEGVIYDSSNKEPLPIANVYIEELKMGAMSDGKGFYFIENIPVGSYAIKFSYIGYKEKIKKITIEPGVTKKIDVYLVPTPMVFEEIVVSVRKEEFKSGIEPSRISFNIRESVEKYPTFVQADLLKALQSLPGISGGNDFSSALHVRGGSADENLILLDGTIVYNPFHLGGILSNFDPDAIGNLEMYTGGFPARYGGKLSSVLAIEGCTGKEKGHQEYLYLTPILCKALGKGQYSNFSYLLVGRLAYLNELTKFMGREFPYSFRDLEGKIEMKASPFTKISALGFFSEDIFDSRENTMVEGGKIHLKWSNKIISINVKRTWSENVFTKWILGYSHYDNYQAIEPDYSLSLYNRAYTYCTKLELSYFFQNKGKIEAGIEAEGTDFIYKYFYGEWDRYLYAVPNIASGYFQWSTPSDKKIALSLGLRTTYTRVRYNLGRLKDPISGFLYRVEPPIKAIHSSTNHLNFSPRIAGRYFLTENIALKASWGVFHQYIIMAQPEQIQVPSVCWIPIFGKYEPQKALHYIIGVEHLWRFSSLSLELYYKDIPKIVELNQEMELSNVEETWLISGTAEAYGIDLLFKKDIGRISGWLTYSFSKCRVELEDIIYPPRWNREHSSNIFGEIKLGRDFSLSLCWTLGTGFPYSEIIGWYRTYKWDYEKDEFQPERWRNVHGTKNMRRLPPYHRLDIGIKKITKLKGIPITIGFQILNVYNNKNVLYYYYDHSKNPPEKKAFYMLPILPSLNIEIQLH